MTRVLVVDDNLAIGRMLTMILGNDGHDVVAVASGAEAVQHLRGKEVDVVFSEWRVWIDMDGPALVRLRTSHVA